MGKIPQSALRLLWSAHLKRGDRSHARDASADATGALKRLGVRLVPVKPFALDGLRSLLEARMRA
jgi:hypothetical protein